MTKDTLPKGWKLCKRKGGCSKSPDDEMVHDGQWKVKKAA